MLSQKFFDLARPYGEAVDLDTVILAVHDVKVSVLIQPADIAGAEPAIAENASGGFRVLKITLNHVLAANVDFSYLAAGEPFAVITRNLYLDSEDGRAHAPRRVSSVVIVSCKRRRFG